MSQKGKKILFVGTKAQAKDAIQQRAKRLRMPYVSERWLGGMLTNFSTMRRAMKRMQSMSRLMREPAYQHLAKRERLMMQREKIKREKLLGGILELTRLPDVLFIVDINREKIAVQEAQSLNIPIVAMVDTNSDPSIVDYPIPANDDSTLSIESILTYVSDAVAVGLEARKKVQKQALQDKDGNVGVDTDGTVAPDQPAVSKQNESTTAQAGDGATALSRRRRLESRNAAPTDVSAKKSS